MKNLPKIVINQDGSKSVNARDIHAFIGSKQEFAHWIVNQIEAYGFTEREDFLINLSKTSNGRPKKEYLITIDVAKELAMVERNEKGREMRKYFIEVEKKAREIYQNIANDDTSKILFKATEIKLIELKALQNKLNEYNDKHNNLNEELKKTKQAIKLIAEKIKSVILSNPAQLQLFNEEPLPIQNT